MNFIEIFLQVIIEGMSPNTEYGDMAIDDVVFSPQCVETTGTLPPGTTLIPTTMLPCANSDEFHCGDGVCVNVDKYCDGKSNLFSIFVIQFIFNTNYV